MPDLVRSDIGWVPKFAALKVFAQLDGTMPNFDKLSADINKVLKEPASLERWKTLGFDPIGTTPEAFAERQKADLAYWKKMIDYTGIKVE